MIPLVSLSNVEKTIGSRTLFSGLSFAVNENERVILIGPNGAGKSTLFKLLAGELSPDEGTVSTQKGMKRLLVAQSDNYLSTGTVSEALYNSIQDDADAPRKVSQCLALLGFKSPDLEVNSISGGWRKRLAIGCALVQEPDMLLLDEPTNHLDIESILWLEEVVRTFRGAVVSISHDRYFIERTGQRVVELNQIYPKGFFSVSGGYSDFLESREEYFAQRESQRSSLANKVRREVEWLRQGVKARTTKSQARIKSAHSLQSELENMKGVEGTAKLDLIGGERRSKEYVVLQQVGFGFESLPIIKNFTFTLGPGVRLGITGPNGTGKTTLVKVLVGDLAPTAGKVKAAKGLNIVYLDQARARVRDDITVKQLLCPEGNAVVVQGKEFHIIPWAKRFLFTPEHLDKPLSKLSGGEKARALLASIMSQPVDVLILDEPTNDLDIPTREILESALIEFGGAVILVSHDRYMLDTVCTSLVGLDGSSEAVVCASYSQWQDVCDAKQKEAKESKGKASQKNKAVTDKVEQSSSKLTYGERIELSKMEAAIEKAEARVSTIQEKLSSTETTNDREWFEKQCLELSAAESAVNELYQRWEFLLEKQQKQ